MISSIIVDTVSEALMKHFVAQIATKSSTTGRVLVSMVEDLKEVYGDEELLGVSMDEAQIAMGDIDVQSESELDDIAITAMYMKMEFSDSTLPLVWFLLKTRPNRDKKIMKKTLKVERYITRGNIGLKYYTGCKGIVQKWGDVIQQFWSLNNESTTNDIPLSPSYRIVPENEHNGTNPLNRIKENVTVRAIRESAEAVMEAKDEKGGRVFTQQSQWSGFYLVLHDLGYYDKTDNGFAGFLRSLGIVPKEPLHLKRVELFKGFGKRRPRSFASWSPDGSEKEKKVYEVARLFKEELEKRLPKK